MMYVFTRIDLQDLFPRQFIGTDFRRGPHRAWQDLGVYQVLSGKGIKTVLFSLGARGLDHFLDPVPLQKNHDIPSGKHTKKLWKMAQL